MKDWKYTDFYDLVGSQIEITRLSYDTHSKEYAESWEWDSRVAGITRKDYMDPFMREVRPGGIVLVVGCGTGRDLKLLGERGYKYLGIDTSMGMLDEAVKNRNVDGPVLCADLESLKVVDESFDGILIDSAIEHVKKADVADIIEKLYGTLKKGGVCLIRFRLGGGKVFVVNDMVGKRYFTSYSKAESRALVTSNGFEVVSDYVTDHSDESRPGFHSYILRK